MAAALPAAITATGSTVTEAQFKNYVTALHDYLAGLLGTSGAASDALAALGIGSSMVSSFNGRVGAVTLSGTDISNAGAMTAGAANATYFSGFTYYSTAANNGGTDNFYRFIRPNGTVYDVYMGNTPLPPGNLYGGGA